MKKPILITALALISVSAWGFDSYKCTIKSTVEVGKKGVVEHVPINIDLTGLEFVVDRDTGRMLGALENHDMGIAPKVMQRGGDQHPFTAIANHHDGYPYVEYLQVDEWKDGYQKPFTYMSSGRLYTGLCEHY